LRLMGEAPEGGGREEQALVNNFFGGG